MKDIFKSSLLYDFYGELLTEHQKEIYEDFYGIPLEYTTECDKENVNV